VFNLYIVWINYELVGFCTENALCFEKVTNMNKPSVPILPHRTFQSLRMREFNPIEILVPEGITCLFAHFVTLRCSQLAVCWVANFAFGELAHIL